MADAKKKFADAVHTTTTIDLSYADRLRVLFGAPIRLRVHVRTEHEVGATETSSDVTVGTPKSKSQAFALLTAPPAAGETPAPAQEEK